MQRRQWKRRKRTRVKMKKKKLQTKIEKKSGLYRIPTGSNEAHWRKLEKQVYGISPRCKKVARRQTRVMSPMSCSLRQCPVRKRNVCCAKTRKKRNKEQMKKGYMLESNIREKKAIDVQARTRAGAIITFCFVWKERKRNCRAALLSWRL